MGGSTICRVWTLVMKYVTCVLEPANRVFRPNLPPRYVIGTFEALAHLFPMVTTSQKACLEEARHLCQGVVSLRVAVSQL